MQDAVVTISQPVTWEEAEILIKCCPTDRMAGVEWSLLHCIESCISNLDLSGTSGELEKYRSLIKKMQFRYDERNVVGTLGVLFVKA